MAGVLGRLPEDAAVTSDDIVALKAGDKPSDGDEEGFGFLGWAFLIAYVICAIIFLYIFVDSLRKNIKRLKSGNEEEVNKAYKTILDDERTLLLYLIVCTPVFALLPFYLVIATRAKKKYRTQVRVCSCGHEMRLLSEAEEDPFMNENQLFEENNLKVKDYDVWYCGNCGHTITYYYKGIHSSSYKECSHCRLQLLKKTKHEVVSRPTYTSSGLNIDTYTCQHCGYTKTERVVVPRLERSSSSSSGGGSHGGSFGGGHSGGGGATGRW